MGAIDKLHLGILRKLVNKREQLDSKSNQSPCERRRNAPPIEELLDLH
jgi:hypothetical protein